MNGAQLTQLLYCFCTLSVLLLVGTFLRAAIPAFRKLFMPASVIGGFIGLLVGPVIWGSHTPVQFPAEWIATWSALPGILIVPVVASVPLGMKVGKDKQQAGGAKKASTDSLKMFAVISGVAALQVAIGMGTNAVFTLLKPEMGLYQPFGYELSQGFAGGHGTAGVVGSFYKQLNLDYWEVAQGVTTTTATFGLIGGMIMGIIGINVAARKGKTAVLKKPGDIPMEMAKGYQMNPEKQNSLGRETTFNSSIDTMTFHLAVILGGCGLAYVVMNAMKALAVPGLSNVPIWAYAIVVMFGVNYVIQKIGLGNLIDTKTKSRISGTCSDFAITAAIASMPVKAIMQYMAPILCMVLVGYAVTYFGTRMLCNYLFNDYQVERSMAVLGTCTGVFLTGLMLLKICDPDYETPVINDFSIGFSFTSVLGFALMPVYVGCLLKYSAAVNVIIHLAIFLIYLLVGVGASKLAGESSAEKVSPAAAVQTD